MGGNVRRYVKAMSNIAKNYSKISKMGISDVNKHQYLSCLGGQGGYLGRRTIISLGNIKEKYDYRRKMKNPEKYGGVKSIIEDGRKDKMNNNIGSAYGMVNSGEGACDRFLNRKK